jgi:DNA adenine methylase
MSRSIPVLPVAPAAGYIGGKRNLARRVIALLGTIPHDSYAEPFVGMGGIFLRRPTRPAAEAINDVSGDIATFFRVLQEHYPYFIDMLRWRVASRAEFERLRAIPGDRLTDLQGVVIEQLGCGEFIRRYDRDGALFYLDPPYWGCETDYGQDVFGRADFAALADQLAGIKGAFVLSINDTPGAREVFGRFAMIEVPVTYTVGAGAPKKVGELIISNRPIQGGRIA